MTGSQQKILRGAEAGGWAREESMGMWVFTRGPWKVWVDFTAVEAIRRSWLVNADKAVGFDGVVEESSKVDDILRWLNDPRPPSP